MKRNIDKSVRMIPFILSFLAVMLVFYDIGFDQSQKTAFFLRWIYMITLISTFFLLVSYYIQPADKRPGVKVLPFDMLFLGFVLLLIIYFMGWQAIPGIAEKEWTYLALFYIFVRLFFTLQIDVSLNPAQIFLLTFLGIILAGTVLLLLPNATHSGISFIDALFTSTSAVCVTGLIVVDTGSYFTEIGQIIIIILIQLGGLGIMTFTSYFSYFFKGRSSYESQLVLKDITNSRKLGEVLGTLRKIIVFTFSIEAIGVILIYSTLDTSEISSLGDRVFFSVFHSVSGFCNAGFSTLSDSLYETGFRFNYPLHATIASLFIIGGIGFPIVFNFLLYLKHYLINRLFRKEKIYLPWLIQMNTRIVLITTGLLLLFGTIGFYLLEYNNTLAEHDGMGKIVTALFGAATPRTAGFNTVDTSALNTATLLFVMLLMWIGASPNSTGGGIKTSSFAVALLNIFSIARGKDRIEVFRREISGMSVKRAFSVIMLSVMVIGIATLLIASFEEDKPFLDIVFESISAFGTVGLSMGITGNLSSASKLVVIITMFAGRVGTLTILVAVLRKIKFLQYSYPTEEIFIN